MSCIYYLTCAKKGKRNSDFLHITNLLTRLLEMTVHVETTVKNSRLIFCSLVLFNIFLKFSRAKFNNIPHFEI